MKTPLGMEVDPGPGHIVLNGDLATPSPPRKGHSSSPSFQPMSIVANAELLHVIPVHFSN